MKEIKVLTDFIENWKKNAIKFYINISNMYLIKRREIDDLYKKYDGSYYKTNQDKDYIEKYKQFINFKNLNFSFITKLERIYYKDYEKFIKEFVENEGNKKLENFVKKVEDKAGEILDVSNLKLSPKMEIDGIVIGSKEKVRVNTIYAGGYNIQCLHFRVLVKIIK